jgi:hypothetical protein
MFNPTLYFRRFLLTFVCGASVALAVAFPAVARATPNCTFSTAGDPNKCCVKVGDAPGPGPDCVSNHPDQGLLGNLPLVGNLPGLGRIL